MNFVCTQAAKDKTRAVISFFFNARGDDIEKSTAGMYRSLLFQLLSRLPSLLDIFDDPEYKDALDEMHAARAGQGRLSEWPATLLQDLLRSGISRLRQGWLTIFVDALDECEQSQVEEMVEFFEELGQDAASNGHRLTICFSSRHYPLIDIQYGRKLTLELEDGQEQDIAMYINSKLKIGTSKTATEIKSTLQTKSCRIFMWVVLVVDILKAEYRNGRIFDVKKRLDILPTKLNDLFKEILLRDQNNLEDLRLCFQWLIFAKRPLTLEEYYFASVSGLNPGELRHWDPEEVTRDDMRRFVLSSSKGLAETTRSKASIVQFIHESVREFFLKDGLKQLWPEAVGQDFQSISHLRLQKCCHAYVELDVLPFPYSEELVLSNPFRTKEEWNMLASKFPFLDYATQYILHHAEEAKGCTGGALQHEFLARFDVKAWIYLNNVREKFEVRRYRRNTNILYILAEKNLPNLIIAAASISGKAEDDGNRYHYPLFAALANNSRDAVRALLQIGTEELPTDMFCSLEYGRSLKVPKGQTPLTWAARNGHETVMRLLLQKGEDFETEGEHFASLIFAISQGYLELVQLLISRGAYANSPKFNLFWPMVAAARSGQEDIIRLFLGIGADSSRVSCEATDAALISAASMGNLSCVRLLLENGAKVNPPQPDPPKPPVSRATVVPQWRLIHASIQAKDSVRMMPLHAAILGGNEAVVRLLLESGANVDQDAVSVLRIAARRGHEAIVRLLLESGASLNSVDGVKDTPLYAASESGHEGIVRLLLENGALVNESSYFKSTPLYTASKNGHEGVVRLLLENGASLNSADGLREMSRYAAYGNQDILRLLFDADASPNSADGLKETPLFVASKNGHEGIVRLLLENGASPNSGNG